MKLFTTASDIDWLAAIHASEPWHVNSSFSHVDHHHRHVVFGEYINIFEWQSLFLCVVVVCKHYSRVFFRVNSNIWWSFLLLLTLLNLSTYWRWKSTALDSSLSQRVRTKEPSVTDLNLSAAPSNKEIFTLRSINFFFDIHIVIMNHFARKVRAEATSRDRARIHSMLSGASACDFCLCRRYLYDNGRRKKERRVCDKRSPTHNEKCATEKIRAPACAQATVVNETFSLHYSPPVWLLCCHENVFN